MIAAEFEESGSRYFLQSLRSKEEDEFASGRNAVGAT